MEKVFLLFLTKTSAKGGKGRGQLHPITSVFCSDGHFYSNIVCRLMRRYTDYGRSVRKSPSLHGRKSNPNPNFIDTDEAYFICHIGPKFQVSLIYAFIGCLLGFPAGLQLAKKENNIFQLIFLQIFDYFFLK